MQPIITRCQDIWSYIINHKWSKDILRGNCLFLLLIILYQLCHFHLAPIHGALFIKCWLLMNVCLLFKLLLDGVDRYWRN